MGSQNEFDYFRAIKQNLAQCSCNREKQGEISGPDWTPYLNTCRYAILFAAAYTAHGGSGSKSEAGFHSGRRSRQALFDIARAKRLLRPLFKAAVAIEETPQPFCNRNLCTSQRVDA
jgi:hypothetical protein